MSEKIVQLNEDVIKGQLKELVRGSVEETLNELLEAEAEKLTQAARYERSEVRQGYRSGHYDRNLTTTSGEVLHADETTLQVLHELGKKAQTKSYMWLYRTGRDDGPPIVLYEYQPSWKAEHAAKFLNGFSGYLHADGYQGYHKLPGNIRVVGCWAHARRKFDEALNALPTYKRKGTTALTGPEYCNKLFAWEEQFKGRSPEERRKQRLKEEKPILDALLAWADSVSAAPKSALGKALHCLKKQWPYLLRYLEDGRLELSNNRAERSIKPFVIGRKNFLFANTPLGAQASAVICSLIEMVKETGLDPFHYLTWVLKTAPTLDRTVEGWAVPLLPANAPEFCATT